MTRHAPQSDRFIAEFEKELSVILENLGIHDKVDISQIDSETEEPPMVTLETLRHALHCDVYDLLPGMKTGAPSPRYHQLHAIDWVIKKLTRSNSDRSLLGVSNPWQSLGLLIADAPGLGKTLIILGVLSWVRCWALSGSRFGSFCGITSMDEVSGPVIIACPGSVQLQWQLEARRWIPSGSYEFFLYPTAGRDKQLWWKNTYQESNTAEQYRVIIISHTTLTMEYKSLSADTFKETEADYKTIFDANPWLVVVDEAHMARNEGTNLFKALCELQSGTPCRLLLTATPIHNRVEDILSMISLMGIKLTNSETKLVKHIKRSLPLFRAKARQYLESTLKEPTLSGDQDHSPVLDERSMAKRIGFGKDYIEGTIRAAKSLLRGQFIRRDHGSRDWEGNPLLVLPNKRISTVEVTLSPEDRRCYEKARGASKQGLIAKEANCKVKLSILSSLRISLTRLSRILCRTNAEGLYIELHSFSPHQEYQTG
jgi:SNF2 family DNA or RNA helicase